MSQAVPHVEHRDDVGSKMGMWLFIFTELFLFGGLFLVYAVYRKTYPQEFHDAALQLNVFIGAVNTVLLLVSSATVAMSITAVQKNDSKLCLKLLLVTLLLAGLFLVNKYFEYTHKFEVGLYPGSELMMNVKHGAYLFVGLYFFITGLHGFHIVVGMILITVAYVKVKSKKITSDNHSLLENVGLYWHLVDLIWIFVFPLLYLIT